ncbi:MAG TPA: adenylate/guanylate cyclase domain-containing protein [Hyphomicrobiaceae bacterium]|nr:adenylate/guanylate cyclase domain-containing protein [Hyphomicrobiaceae bacterium]
MEERGPAPVNKHGSERRPERKLAAILAADVVGYSRLMGVDEEETLTALRAHRAELIDPVLAAHKGRLVKTTGDGLLVEFASVVDALRCALEWQQGMAQRNAEIPEDRRLVFRIGINLGDVMAEGDDIFGDGVNVAARLEGLAKPGTICLSRAARDQVRDKLPVAFEGLGELRVKNIARPVQAFLVVPEAWGARVSSLPAYAKWNWRPVAVAAGLVLAVLGAGWLAWHAPWRERQEAGHASPARATLPLPDKPSIAVLPFDTIGGDPQQLNLGDGLAENVIASLSKLPQMFVIARNSAFTYKGKPVKVQMVAQELGVRYVLEGSVQTSGTKMRMTARLIDAATGYHLWSETYDRGLADIFALQDDITLNVVTALQIELTHGEQARVRQRGTNNLRAWLLVNQSFEHLMQFTKDANARARKLAAEALSLDPNYPEAYVRLARTHLMDFQTGWATNRNESLKQSVELARKALEIDRDYPDTYILLGAIYLFLHQHEAALVALRKALDLSPNHSLAKAHLGMTLTYAGEPEAGIAQLKEAMRLSPLYPDWFLGELGRAYFQVGRYEEAIDVLTRRLRHNPDSGEALVLLAAAASAAGRDDEARRALSKFLTPRPAYTLKHYSAGEFYKNPSDLQRVLEALRNAGLPDSK